MVYQETILVKGAPVALSAIDAYGQTFHISGRLLKTASLRLGKTEWQQDVNDPYRVIEVLKSSPVTVDLFRFWQRIPESTPKYPFYREWRQIAAIPIKTYKEWLAKQISPKARNKVRKAQRLGVVVRQTELTDDFVRGVMEIYNESPVRRGKPFWHYGKSFETVKQELALDLAESVFVGAYFNDELIGFIKFVVCDRNGMTMLILDKRSHRDKAPMNSCIAKVVEICAERKIPYFTYTVWRRGEHGQFQESNGFIKIPVPEYFVPLTTRGAFALRLGLHKGFKDAIPDRILVQLLGLRAKWYAFKHSEKG